MSNNHEIKCKNCGWEGRWKELLSRTVYEDFGDVSCAVCPNCHSTEYEGMELFEEVGRDG